MTGPFDVRLISPGFIQEQVIEINALASSSLRNHQEGHVVGAWIESTGNQAFRGCSAPCGPYHSNYARIGDCPFAQSARFRRGNFPAVADVVAGP
jgi:hypothetical protein